MASITHFGISIENGLDLLSVKRTTERKLPYFKTRPVYELNNSKYRRAFTSRVANKSRIRYTMTLAKPGRMEKTMVSKDRKLFSLSHRMNLLTRIQEQDVIEVLKSVSEEDRKLIISLIDSKFKIIQSKIEREKKRISRLYGSIRPFSS